MKKIFLLLSVSMCLMASPLLRAQRLEKATIEVKYHHVMMGDRQQPQKKTTDEVILLIGDRYTSCYSFLNYTSDSLQKANPSEYSPRITDGSGKPLKSDETVADIRGRGAVPIVMPARTKLRRNTYNKMVYYVDRNSNTLECLDKIVSVPAGVTYYRYSEPLPRPAWQIYPDIDTIAAYPCQKACVSYGGREWTAWFAPSIPISEGPWKLRGLPGLILKAHSADGEFLWIATSVSRSSARTIAKDQSNDYRRVGKEVVLKARREAFASIAPVDYNEIEIVK